MPRSCDDTPLGHVDFQHGSMFSSIRRLVSNVHYLNPNCRCKKGLHAVWMAGALLYGLNPLCCGTCGRACAWELYPAISVMKWWGSDTQILLLRWWMRQWRWMGGWGEISMVRWIRWLSSTCACLWCYARCGVGVAVGLCGANTFVKPLVKTHEKKRCTIQWRAPSASMETKPKSYEWLDCKAVVKTCKGASNAAQNNVDICWHLWISLKWSTHKRRGVVPNYIQYKSVQYSTNTIINQVKEVGRGFRLRHLQRLGKKRKKL